MGFQVFSPVVRQYVVVIAVNLVVISCGVGIAWTSPMLVKLHNVTETIIPTPITEDEGSWIVSVGPLGVLFVNFLPAFLVDRVGRKNCIILGCIPKIIVGLLYTFTTRLWMVLLGRFLNGISDALIFTAIPMYASEIGSKEVRGSLGSILQICSSIGILLALSIGPVVSYATLNIIFTVLTLLAAVVVVFVPDSPYFLYSNGETDKAIKALIFLRGSETIAKAEIKEYAVCSTDSSFNKLKLFNDRIFIKSAIIVGILGAGFQLMGFQAVSFYLETILESTQSTVRPGTGSAIIGAIQLAASICTTVITDRFGRKPILTTTIIGTAIGMLGLGVFFKVKEAQHSVTGAMNYMPLVSLILIVFCYSAGPGSLYWMLITELFSGRTRGVGVGFSMIMAIILIFFTGKYFPDLIATCGPAATYWIFSVNCVLLSLFIMFCVPETRGKSFAEIQETLGVKNIARKNHSEKCNA